METKTVHAYSRETGLYFGPVTLDESDRSPLEPDVWHIPGNCVEDEPPAIPAGHVAVRVGDAWQIIEVQQPAPAGASEPVVAPEPTTEERRAALAQQVQGEMDTQARAIGYDDLKTAITYADEMAVPKFGAEGRAFRAWRSKVWAYFHTVVASDDDYVPEFETLREQMPRLDIAAEQQWADAMTIANGAQARAAQQADETVAAPTAKRKRAATKD